MGGDLGHRRMILEADPKEALKMVNEQIHHGNPWSSIIADIQLLLNHEWECKLQHVLIKRR
jgi:hypothetical protein